MNMKFPAALFFLPFLAAAQLTVDGSVPFRVVIVPDTQNLSEHQFTEQMRWIETNRETAPPIVAMLQVGDMVNDPVPAQWAARLPGLALLTNTPFLLCPGNHDYDFMIHTNNERALTVWNRYVPQRLYTSKAWWSGGFHTNDASENAYLLATNGPTRLLFFALEFGPRTNVLRWVSNVAAAHPDHMVIVATHNYLNPSGTRNASPAIAGRNDPCNPWTYSLFDGAGGEEMWQCALKYLPNLRFVASGHRADGPFNAYAAQTGVHANRVNQLLCDWQATNTANLMIWTFYPSRMEVAVDTYSPVNGTHETGSANQFTMPLLDPAVPAAATATGISILLPESLGSSADLKPPQYAGRVTFAAGLASTSIAFTVAMPSTNYAVYLTRPDRRETAGTLTLSDLGTAGFTLTRDNAESGATVDWEAVPNK
jgi:hypothetical protein